MFNTNLVWILVVIIIWNSGTTWSRASTYCSSVNIKNYFKQLIWCIASHSYQLIDIIYCLAPYSNLIKIICMNPQLLSSSMDFGRRQSARSIYKISLIYKCWFLQVSADFQFFSCILNRFYSFSFPYCRTKHP